MSQFVYKVRHKPTGLFFTPSKYPNNNNLSKRGKIYDRRPTFKSLNLDRILVGRDEARIPGDLIATKVKYTHVYVAETNPEDWEVILYELKDGAVFQI